MSFELVYTSAPRGLREGSSGFCTVAATRGIPRALVKKLESLSGYHHAFPANSGRNPVNYAHTIVRVQQQTYHVLSRIADAGDDHTGRSNKIAHHLAIPAEAASRFKGGPLSLLGDRRYWFESWDREPTELPPGRMPQATGVRTRGFESWETTFGDAGWAGLLGETAEGKPSPAAIIIAASDDALSLLQEAMELVAPRHRWKVGFSTYFNQASSEGCHWRFILEGTEAARKMRGRSAALVIDHKSSRDVPENNRYVQAARAGQPAMVHSTGGTKPKRAGRRPAKAPPKMPASRSPDSSVHARGESTRRMRPSELRRRQAGARGRRARQGYSDDDWDEEDVHELDLDSLEEGSNRSMRPVWIICGIVALILVGLIGFQLFWPSSQSATNDNTEAEATE